MGGKIIPKLHNHPSTGIKTYDDLNPLIDLAQQNIHADNVEKEYHIQAHGCSGASNLGGCKDLRAKRMAGIKLPSTSGLKAEKGAMQIGTMIHADTESKLEAKYKDHQNIKVVSEVYIKQPILKPSDHKVVVGVKTLKYNVGDIVEDKGMTVISPIDNKYIQVKDTSKPLVNLIPTPFQNHVFDLPFLNDENCTTLKDIDIKGQGDFAFFLHRKEGLPLKYIYQGHAYMQYGKQRFMDFLLIHKEKNWRYIIRLYYQKEIWDQLTADQDRVLQLFYEYLEDGIAETHEEDFACLNREIDWYSCPLSTTYEEVDKLGKPRLKLVTFCPRAMQLLEQLKIALLAKGEWFRYGRGQAYILGYGKDHEYNTTTIRYCTKTEWRKREKGQRFTEKSLFLAEAWRQFKSLDQIDPGFADHQDLILPNPKDLKVESCCGCVHNDKKGHCVQYNCVPTSFPEQPDWCEYSQRDIHWEQEHATSPNEDLF